MSSGEKLERGAMMWPLPKRCC